MWTLTTAYTGMAARSVESPAPDPSVFTVDISRSGAAVLISLLILGLLSFTKHARWTWVKIIAIVLGIGSLVITSEWALDIGTSLRRSLGSAFASTGHPELAASSVFTILAIVLLLVAVNWYRRTESFAAFFVTALVCTILFTASFARELAIIYAQHVALPVMQFVLGFFG